MHYPPHLKPEENLLRLVYAGTLSIAQPVEEFAAWCVTGVAAILGLLVANLNSVSKIVSVTGLRWGIIFLVISMLAGATAKQLGIAIRKGLTLLDELYVEFDKPEGKAMLQGASISPEEFQSRMAAPFLQPLRKLMLQAARNDAVDLLAAEKRLIKLFCIQIYASWVQSISAVVGILTLALGIHY